MSKTGTLSAEKRRKTVLTVFFAVICVIYVLPVLAVVINSFKLNTFVKTDTFALPNSESGAGFSNFVKGMTFGNYPFWKSVFYSAFITVVSTALILLFTSMAAWYISRVDSVFCRIVYYLCVFSMVVPFQMVMYTLSKTADSLHLNTPWTIPVVYLGFGAGLAIFMFAGFVKSIPLEIEEAAAIDGAGSFQLFRYILAPLLRPMIVTCAIFSFSGTVKMFESAKALTGGGPGNATKSLSMYMYEVAFNYNKVGYGSVIALFIFLMCIVGSFIIGLFDTKEDI